MATRPNCQYQIDCCNPAIYKMFNSDKQKLMVVCEGCSKNFIVCSSCPFMTENLATCDKCYMGGPKNTEPPIDMSLKLFMSRSENKFKKRYFKPKSGNNF